MHRVNPRNMRLIKQSPIVLLSIILFLCSNIRAETFEPASFPSLLSCINVDTPLEFCGEVVPVENQEIRERLEKELLLTLWNRAQVILWLKRSSRYFPIIEETLAKSGMPDDLKYIAIAESALRPHARSKKGAVGFWQFIKPTGKTYGLDINRRIDQRRNIFASTQAAINYLTDLHETFGSWTLAASGYNMGENRLMAEIVEQGTRSYYHLHLPRETQRYVFRILSAKLILSDPGKYGFHLSDDDYYPPLKFDRIQVDCAQNTPIRIIAQAAKTHFKTIRDLNPEIRGRHLPRGRHQLLIPKGASKHFRAEYQPHLENWLGEQKKRVYVIKRGDSLSSIADRFNVPLAALLFWNRLDLNEPIHPGDHLIIHKDEARVFKINLDKYSSTSNRTSVRALRTVVKGPLPPANKILSIQLVARNEDHDVRIIGNGRLDDYEVFMLKDPSRVVIDLWGIQSTEVADDLSLGGPLVKKVRVGLHANRVRIVFDLDHIPDAEVPYQVVSKDDRLQITFSSRKILAQTPRDGFPVNTLTASQHVKK